MRLASHPKRNRCGILYFRRVVPPELQFCFAFRQIARSLYASNCQEARSIALRYSAAIDLLFSQLRVQAAQEPQYPMSSKSIRTDLIIRLDFDPDGTLKPALTDAQPEEADAAARIGPAMVGAARDVTGLKGVRL